MSVTQARLAATGSNFRARWLSATTAGASAHAGAAAIADLRPQAFTAHQPGDPVLAAALAQIAQVPRDLAVAVDAAAFQPGLFDQAQHAPVLLGPRRQRRTAPCVVPAGVQPQDAAHAADPEVLLMVAHE